VEWAEAQVHTCANYTNGADRFEALLSAQIRCNSLRCSALLRFVAVQRQLGFGDCVPPVLTFSIADPRRWNESALNRSAQSDVRMPHLPVV
jgi:hypothetical protein